MRGPAEEGLQWYQSTAGRATAVPRDKQRSNAEREPPGNRNEDAGDITHSKGKGKLRSECQRGCQANPFQSVKISTMFNFTVREIPLLNTGFDTAPLELDSRSRPGNAPGCSTDRQISHTTSQHQCSGGLISEQHQLSRAYMVLNNNR